MGKLETTNPTEYLTINQFATKANVSPQAIYKKLRNPDFQPYTTTLNGKRMIHESALQDFYGIKLEADQVTREEKQDYEIQLLKELIQELKEQVQGLREQLSVKDEQIKSLNEALINSQKLHLLGVKPVSGEADPEGTQSVESNYQEKANENIVPDQYNMPQKPSLDNKPRKSTPKGLKRFFDLFS